MLQVAWERCLIDETKVSLYTVPSCKDEMEILQHHTILKFLLGNCTDFAGEEMPLQSKGSALGVLVDHTLKCHCELAGEGIEYSFGMCQEFLPPATINRQMKKSFRNTIKKCAINRENKQVLEKGKTVCASISCNALWAAADISSIEQFI